MLRPFVAFEPQCAINDEMSYAAAIPDFVNLALEWRDDHFPQGCLVLRVALRSSVGEAQPRTSNCFPSARSKQKLNS